MWVELLTILELGCSPVIRLGDIENKFVEFIQLL